MLLDPYQKSFSDFLSGYKFKTFGTFTTKLPLSLKGARRLAVNFARKIGAGDSSSMFWAAEPFDAREGYHFHALINTYGRLSNQQMKDHWQDEKGYGIGQFLEIRRALGKEKQIENYCSKYITKYMADYDFYIGSSMDHTTKTGIPDKPDYIKPYNHV